MKRTLIVLAAVVVLGAIIIFSIRAGSGDGGEKVYVEPVKPRSIESIVTASGEIDPKFKVNISAHVIGKIEKLYFKEGDIVRKGQTLVDLERPAYAAQYDRSTSVLANRRIEVQRAKAALGTAELAYKRAVNMQQQGIQAQELFDQSKLAYENAHAALASAEEQVREAQATVEQTANDLSHTTITSPIDGKVVQLNAHEGEVVITGTMNNPGSVIAVIADLSQILVEAEVGETEVVGIRVGHPAKVKVDAVPNVEYAGHVVEIASSAAVRQNAGSGIRYFLVKVAIDNPDDRLRPGMTSQVSIITSTAANTPSVPIQSVVERASTKKEEPENDDAPKKKYVFVVKAGKVRMAQVATGISNATHVAITSGVKAGDSVVSGPFRTLKKLQDGDSVQVVKEEKKSDSSTGD